MASVHDLLSSIASGSTTLASGTGVSPDELPGLDASVFSTSNLIANLLFSAIGFVAFVYGRKMSRLKPALLGICLMGYPWFVSNPWLMWGTGFALTTALFVFRD